MLENNLMSVKADVIPSSEVLSRVQNLRKKLNDANLGGALLLFSQECYYYSRLGIEGAVFVPVEGEPVHLIKRNLAFGCAHSAIARVQEFGRQSKSFETLGIKSGTKLAIEADLLPFSFVKYLQSKADDIELVDGSQLFRQLRAVKSDFEIGSHRASSANG